MLGRPFILSLLSLLGACAAPPSAPLPSPPPAPVAPTPSHAGASRRTVTHAETAWLSYEFDLAHVQLGLVGQRPGEPKTFQALERWLGEHGSDLVLATNAGIFDRAHRPLGLHVENGEMLSPLSTEEGTGNFYLKPNGVFWVDEAGAHVASTERYVPKGMLQLATQSGPLLLDGGRMHPTFARESKSLKLRSAVGVDSHGHVHIVLSMTPVSFFATATLFRDVLHCENALYLDGEISGFAGPEEPVAPTLEYGGLIVALRRAR